jgi:hypothetical protein
LLHNKSHLMGNRIVSSMKGPRSLNLLGNNKESFDGNKKEG